MSLRSRSSYIRLGIGFGGMLTITGLSGLAWIEKRIQQDLVPLITQEIQTAIDRPVDLGQLQQISLTGLRLGRSSIPATPTDSDSVAIEEIDIQFNLLEALQHQKVSLEITLIRPQLELDQDREGNWLDTKIKFEEGDFIEIKAIKLRQASVILAPNVELAKTVSIPDVSKSVEPVRLQQINGVLTLKSENQVTFNVQGKAPEDSRLRLQGEVNLATETLAVTLTAETVSIAPLVSLLDLPVVIQSGKLSGQIRLQKHHNQTIALEGVAQLQQVAARAPGEPNPFSDIEARLRFHGQAIQIEQGHLQFGQIPFAIQGKIDLQQGLDLKAQVDSVSADAFMHTFNLKVPFAVTGGLGSEDIRVQGSFDHVVFSGTAHSTQPIQLDRVPFRSAQTRFRLDKSTDQLTLENVEFFPEGGGRITTQAHLTLENEQAPLAVTVEAVEVSADTLAQIYGFPDGFLDDFSVKAIGQVNASAQLSGTGNDPKITGQWQLAKGAYPAQGTIAGDKDQILLHNKAEIFGGTLQADGRFAQGEWQAQIQGKNLQVAGGALEMEGRLAKGNWQAEVQGKNLQAHAFSPQLTGVVESDVQLSGSLANLSQQAIQANGTLQLSQTDFLAEPLTASLSWEGDRLHILKATIPGAAVSGWVKPSFDRQPAIQAMDLSVNLQNYDLAALPLAVPDSLNLGGQVNFEGRLTGTSTLPHLFGQVQLEEFALNQLTFEPLRGKIQFAERGLEVDLTGRQDQIKAWIDRHFQTASVQVQADQAIAEGQYRDGHLWGKVQQLSLQQIRQMAGSQFDPFQAVDAKAIDFQELDGRLSAGFNFSGLNSAQPQGVVNFSLTHPVIGPVALVDRPGHSQDGFTGALVYLKDVATLTDGRLKLGSSEVNITGKFAPGEAAQALGHLSIDRGNIQDFGATVDWMQHSEGLTAALPALAALPDLTALQGQFSAEVTLQSNPSDFSAAFDLAGKDWNWQAYGIRQIAAKGQMNSEQINLKLLQLQGLNYVSDQGRQEFDTRLSLVGEYSKDRQRGKLQVDKVPVAAIKQWFDASLPLEGEINATANIMGNIAAPEVEGQLHLSQLRLKAIELPATQLHYAYRGGRLSIGGISAQPEEHQTENLNPEAIQGAKRIYFAVGPIDFTLPVRVLKTYVDTGEVNSPLGFYAQFLGDQTLQSARSLLHQPLDMSQVNLPEILNSPTGEAWLTWLGELIQTQSGDNGKASIRAAMIAAADSNPDGVTLMDVLSHYPVPKIRINTAAVRTLMRTEQQTEQPL
ncbi:MAG TPA: alpha/beta hydrolase [Coleofasciculaceae cyanobacterium]